MLAASGLSKIYGAGPRRLSAVDGVSLEVAAGEFLAVVGRSGSGKSTLLGMLGGLSRPTTGTVLLDGEDLWSLRDSARTDVLCRKIGFVFQFASLLPTLRAADNVALPALIARTLPASEAYARAAALLKRVGLSHRADAYPGELSGGEQRRVALARALVNAPPLLLADEPTADLDEDTEAEMLALLLDIHRTEQLTLVVVTHNTDIAAQADRVVEVRQGRLVAASLPERTSRPSSVFLASGETLPEQAIPVAVGVSLGHGLRKFVGTFIAWSLLTVLMLLAVNQGLALFQRRHIDEKQQARKALEDTALSKLRADIEDVTADGGRSYEVTISLVNAAGEEPIFVMAPSVRAYIQVGPSWHEVPLRSADGRDGRVLKITGKQAYRYVFEPEVKKFEELIPGYMHMRFTNTMLVSQRSEPADDLVERTDSYYVYLKPPGADDESILRRVRFPGKPPLWIPMPPH